MLLLLCTCSSLLPSVTLADRSQAGSSFVVVEDPITSTSTLRFDKVWHIKSGASGSPAAVANLVLDLPGQVFVSYVESKSVASDVFGVITVSDSVSTTVEAVGISIRSAMEGEKVVIHPKNATALSDDHASLLTTVQLLRKNALKKVITNGAATVVIVDNVLFSKKKEDYKEHRGTRKLEDANNSSLVVQELAIDTKRTTRLWMIKPFFERNSEVPIAVDLNLAIPGVARVKRTDSDLLPEGAIGTIAVASNETLDSLGQIEVVTRHGNSAEIVQARFQDNTMVTKADTMHPESYYTHVELIPEVVCNLTSGSSQQWSVYNELNVYPLDDMVTIFLNGSGNVFVDANDSALYMDDVYFLAGGTGILQVLVKELWSTEGVRVGIQHDAILVDNSVARVIIINGDLACVASTTDGSRSSISEIHIGATDGSANSPSELCKRLETPPTLRETNSLLGESSAPSVTSGVLSLSHHDVCITAALVSLAALVSMQ